MVCHDIEKASGQMQGLQWQAAKFVAGHLDSNQLRAGKTIMVSSC